MLEDVTQSPGDSSTEFSIDEIVVVPDRRVSRVPVAIDRIGSAHCATRGTQAPKTSRKNDEVSKQMHDNGMRTRSRAPIAHFEPRICTELATTRLR